MSSETKPDGGPAFPRKRSVHRKEVISLCGAPNSEYVHDLPQDGMTLRDWFAGMALTGLLLDQQIEKENKTKENISSWAYELSDAMLAERNK